MNDKLNPKKWFDKKLDDGIFVKKIWDMRAVENFFKRIFGIKKKKGDKKRYDERRENENR